MRAGVAVGEWKTVSKLLRLGCFTLDEGHHFLLGMQVLKPFTSFSARRDTGSRRNGYKMSDSGKKICLLDHRGINRHVCGEKNVFGWVGLWPRMKF